MPFPDFQCCTKISTMRWFPISLSIKYFAHFTPTVSQMKASIKKLFYVNSLFIRHTSHLHHLKYLLKYLIKGLHLLYSGVCWSGVYQKAASRMCICAHTHTHTQHSCVQRWKRSQDNWIHEKATSMTCGLFILLFFYSGFPFSCATQFPKPGQPTKNERCKQVAA